MAKYYLKDLGVSQKLTFKLLNYLSYIYEKKINLDNQFMAQLPPKTRFQYMKGIIEKTYDFSIFLNLTRP